MATIKRENYSTFFGWMVLDLGLKGNELLAYSIIYGFSQDGESMFTGSLNYLSSWLGTSRPTTIKALQSLVDKGLIIKESTLVNGVTFNKYKVNQNALPVVNNFNQGSKETFQPVVKNLSNGSKETLHNNNINNKDNKDNIVKVKYGEFVKLTEQEHKTLVEKYGEEKVKECIEILDHYIGSKGDKYQSHYHAMYSWVLREYDERHKFDRPNTAVEGELLVW